MVKTKQTANKTTSKKVEVTKKDKAPLPPPKGKGRTTAPKVDKVTASKVVEKKAVAPKKTTTKKVVNEESQDLEGVLEQRLSECETTVKTVEETLKTLKSEMKELRTMLKELKREDKGDEDDDESIQDEGSDESGDTSVHSDEEPEKVEPPKKTKATKPVKATEKVEKPKKLTKQEIIDQLKELGIEKNTVKRSDGEKGAPKLEDFQDALDKALASKKKKNTKKVEEAKPEKKKKEKEVVEEKKKNTKKVEDVPEKKKNTKKVEDVPEKEVVAVTEEESETPKDIEVNLTAHYDKGYAQDESGFLCAIDEDAIFIARLVNGKVTALTAKDIKELEKLGLKDKKDFEKKTLAQINKLFVPQEEPLDIEEKDTSKSSSSDEDEPVVKPLPTLELDDEEEDGKGTIDDTEETEVLEEEKLFADKSAEGTEVTKSEDVSKKAPKDKPSTKDDDDVGADISKNFEEPAVVTKEDFTTFVKGKYSKEFESSDPPKTISSIIGLTEVQVGIIVAKYPFYSKKWSDVITQEKEALTTKAEKPAPTTGGKPQPRKIEKKGGKK